MNSILKLLDMKAIYFIHQMMNGITLKKYFQRKYNRVAKYLRNIPCGDANALRNHFNGKEYDYEEYKHHLQTLANKFGRLGLRQMMKKHLKEPLI